MASKNYFMKNSLLSNLGCLLDSLKNSTWSIIFYVFYSNFSLHDSREKAVSEYLEWLSFCMGFTPKPLRRGLQHPPPHPCIAHRLWQCENKVPLY